MFVYLGTRSKKKKTLNRNLIDIPKIEYVMNFFVNVISALISKYFNIATILKDFFHNYITVFKCAMCLVPKNKIFFS
jgi:hypothetical protein